MLKIWSDKNYLRSVNDIRPILMPFWGLLKEDEPHRDRFDEWIVQGPSIFTFVDDMNNADVVIYPQDPTIDCVGFQKFQAITGNKKLLVFFNSDSDSFIHVRENTTLFRTSVLKTKKQPYEFGLPGWSEDCGYLGDRDFKLKPVIGFCGQDFRPSMRSIALNILNKSSNIETNFIRKSEFWGGWITAGRDPKHGKTLRNEFINNLKNCDYGLCIRGGGNFSYRLYETMMGGRIPVLINTDCLLPYDFKIKWGDYFPIIDGSDIVNISSHILNFHNKFDNITFIQRQKLIREMWENYISPVGFFNNICEHWN